MEKLISIETIDRLYEHSNADTLELVEVLGYQMIVKKGEFKEGESVLFVRPDSYLEDNAFTQEHFSFLIGKRIKAIRLRGEWSFGLVMKLEDRFIGQENLEDLIGVRKYILEDKILPREAKGNFPGFIRKTNEERYNSIWKRYIGEKCQITHKIDGQSYTTYYNLDSQTFGICSRNTEYKLELLGVFQNQVDKYDLQNKITNYCIKNNMSLAFQGEHHGIGIQNKKQNKWSKVEKDWAVFNIFDIRKQQYLNWEDVVKICEELKLTTVETIAKDVIFDKSIIEKYEKEKIGFEGVVVKFLDGNSFKIINFHYDAS